MAHFKHKTAMKNDFFGLFGLNTKWFKELSRKHRFFVIYFLLSFLLLCSISENLLWVLFVALNFWNSVRLLKQVPTDGIEDL